MSTKNIKILATGVLRTAINSKINNQIPKKNKSVRFFLGAVCEHESVAIPEMSSTKLIRRALTYWVNNIGPINDCCRKAVIDVVDLRSNTLSVFGPKSCVIDEHLLVISHLPSSKFYKTREWEALRYSVLRDRGAVCECCGASGRNVEIHVDHIKPRSIFPEFSLQESNLQILCGPCNRGKSNIYDDDWRAKHG